MSKYFKLTGIILLFTLFLGVKGANSQYLYHHRGPSYWSSMTSYDKAYFGINQFFNAVNYSIRTMERTQAYEQRLQNYANRIENAKSIRRYYTEGIPAFSPIAPNGQPRSEKITWQDVDSIRP